MAGCHANLAGENSGTYFLLLLFSEYCSSLSLAVAASVAGSFFARAAGIGEVEDGGEDGCE